LSHESYFKKVSNLEKEKKRKKGGGGYFLNPSEHNSDHKTQPDKDKEDKIQIPQTLPQVSRLQQSS